MTNVFLSVVNMSISASILVMLVLILRLAFKKAPRWISVLLWGLVAVRLACPITLESPVSVMPDREWVEITPVEEYTPEEIVPDEIVIPSSFADINVSFDVVDQPEINIEKHIAPSYYLSIIWICGIALMLIYTLVSYIVLYRRVSTAVRLRDNAFQGEAISSPFVLGIIRPHIYLPFGVEGESLEYVIAHEEAHIKRLDHWWKPLGFLLLTLHWFNPIMWLAYILLCRDIESACDERVVKNMNTLERADYSEALLLCSVKRRSVSACPLAFGETGVKSRVKSVLSYKKPAFWVIIAALLVSAATAVCFLTNPITQNESDSKELIEEIEDRNGYEIISQEDTVITLSVHNARLSDAMFTSEGYEFKPGERIAYQDGTTTVYLKHVMVSNESEDKLYFTFDFDYNLPEDSGVYVSPMVISDKGYTTRLSIVDKRLYDGETVYDNGVLVRGQGPNDLIVFYIERDALKTLGDYVSFKVGLNKLTYLKDYERRALSEDEILADAERVASISGYSFIGGRLRNQTDTEVEAIFSNRDGSVYVGVTYEYDNGWVLADTPIREYHTKDLEASVADRFPAVDYYAVAYANKIGDRIAEEQWQLYNGSRASTISELKRVSTADVANGRVELYYMVFWIGKGINGLQGPTDVYETFPRYFAMYVDGREGGEILSLGDISIQELNSEYNNIVMKSRYGDEYKAAAMTMYEKYSGETEEWNHFEDAILRAYNEATEAANWFRIGSMQTNWNDYVDIGDIRYYKTVRFDTRRDLREYLKGLFSVSIVDELLSNDRYIDYDGRLYSNDSARGADIFMGREIYSITRDNEEKYTLTVTVEVYGNDAETVEGYEEFIFTYENISGRWVFTAFPGIR